MRRHELTGSSGSANSRRGLRTAVAVTVASLVLGACSAGRSEPTAAQRELFPVDTEATTTPTTVATSTPPTTLCIRRPAASPSHDAASNAATAALIGREYEKAEGLVDAVEDPALRGKAERAVDLAQADRAAWLAWNDNDFSQANTMLSLVELPGIQALASTAIATSQNEYDLWGQNPRDTKAWHEAYTQGRTEWHELRTQALSAWYDLRRQSSDFCQPA